VTEQLLQKAGVLGVAWKLWFKEAFNEIELAISSLLGTSTKA
jgi:hypothetical protein